MKKILSISLALILALSALAMGASAGKKADLKFDENGEFKIMHVCDCQDGYPASEIMLKYLDLVIKDEKPDIIVLGGDNTICGYSQEELAGKSADEQHKMLRELKKNAIQQLVDVFISNQTPFTLVFGNHDHQQGIENDELLALYQECGGKYCLAYDADPSLTGSGTHFLTVFGSDGSYIPKFNLYMFDSGDTAYDENGKDMGYDSVHADQIEWYKSVRDELKEKTGNYVPSVAFQHIIVNEVYDKLFFENPLIGIREFNGVNYSFFPKTNNFTGHLLEMPCPGYYNYGQFKAMNEKGDVAAMFFGHDHTNSFDCEIEGMRIINTPSPTHHSYSSDLNSGCRIIKVKESNPSEFETYLHTENQVAVDHADFAEILGRPAIVAKLLMVVDKVLLALSKFSGLFIFFVK